MVPNPENILEWHFAVFGLEEPYKNGVYHGVVLLPSNYPKSPPGIKVFTPSGRFQINYKLCLSISDWHPESWNPSWQVYQVILGLISVMSEDVEFGVGMIADSKENRRKFAHDSIQFNLKKQIFKDLFRPHFKKLGINTENDEDDQRVNIEDSKQQDPFEAYQNRMEKRNKIAEYAVPISLIVVSIGVIGFLAYKYK